MLGAIPAGARVLDAACGIGLDARWLARRDVEVTAADASAAMVAATSSRLAAEGLSAHALRSMWLELPERLPSSHFDAVLCVGNAIGHCIDGDEMIATLGAFATMLAPDGILLLDTHHWEVLADQGDVDELDPTVIERHGRRVQRRYRWRWSPDRRRCDITLVLADVDGDDRTHHSVTLHPFTVEQLVDRMRIAGFSDLGYDAHPDVDRYTVTGRIRRPVC